MRVLLGLSAALLVFLGLLWWSDPPVPPRTPDEETLHLLEHTTLPGIQFSNKPLSECMDHLVRSMNAAIPSRTWTWSNADVRSPQQTIRLRTLPPLAPEERSQAPKTLDVNQPITLTYRSASAAELLHMLTSAAGAAHLRTGTHFTLYDPSDKTISPLETTTIDNVFSWQFEDFAKNNISDMDITSQLMQRSGVTTLYQGDRVLWKPAIEQVNIRAGDDNLWLFEAAISVRCITHTPTRWEQLQWKAKEKLQVVRRALFGPAMEEPILPSPTPASDEDPFGPAPEKK